MTYERMLSAKNDLELKLNRLEKQYWKYDAKADAARSAGDAAEALRKDTKCVLLHKEQQTILETLRLLGWDYRVEDREDPEVGTIYRYIVYSPYD